MTRRLAFATLLMAALPATALAKPPWISIELPANPWDEATRGAFLVVHTFHYNRPMAGSISGTAFGVVNGERRTVPLSFEKMSESGDYALRAQWGNTGRWALVITVSQGTEDNLAQAVVQIAEGGVVAGIRVPTRQERNLAIPRRATQAEIEAALRGEK